MTEIFRRKDESEISDLSEYEETYEILQHTHTHTHARARARAHTHTHKDVKILLHNWYRNSKTKFIKLESQD
jgi:ABC-type Zn2+ transport system substrate-binding protein/surface adhesin